MRVDENLRNAFNQRDLLSRKVPPRNFMAKHQILSQYIVEGKSKAGLTVFWEQEVTVEQLQEQCNRLKQLITN
ncbi:hypothetical protein SAMN02745136_00424 [Anaerocolumna jejuensis DSM 15929]|uniref:Uncharacterized protein n=1 Tax=Anaerocolumna jejuensis DSM 15929 TaxID=1121322 RepID=A0A1M6KEH4_9FIRM|nr:hypothetical protein [Anaerocolumna jejuensis]SHJ57351.1 hypothetical protein SAMN02745136_00424 [Anaerocolumna jejuensis DSM 15929]